MSEGDPWNFWVFEVGGDGSWLVNFRADVETETESFDLDDDEEVAGRRVEVTRRERAARLFLAKALGDHWSVGVDSNVQSSTFGNVELSTQLLPAVEYNVFPYSEYATRQLRFEYAVGAEHARYN